MQTRAQFLLSSKAPRLIASTGSIPLLEKVRLGGVPRQVVVSEVLSIASIHKLLMMMVLEDYKNSPCTVKHEWNARPVDSSLIPDVLFDFGIHQRPRSAEEWNMKSTDTDGAHMPCHLLPSSQRKYSRLLHEATARNGSLMLFLRRLRPAMPLLEWTHGPVIPNLRREAANETYMQRLEARAMVIIVVSCARSSSGMSFIHFLDCTPD